MNDHVLPLNSHIDHVCRDVMSFLTVKQKETNLTVCFLL